MWKIKLKEAIPMLGHRNWILIVDAAYPAQTSASMEIINTGESICGVVAEVLKEIKIAKHIRPIIYQDEELGYLADDICCGSESLRTELSSLIEAYDVKEIMHEEVFEKLDSASKLFKVLVLKTECYIPYSSIFIELDCGYWNAESETKLRERILNNHK